MASSSRPCRVTASWLRSAALSGGGLAHLTSGEPDGGLRWFGLAGLDEAFAEQAHESADFVGSVLAAMDAHEPLVQLLVDGVGGDGPFEDGGGLVGLVGFEDFRDAGQRRQVLVAEGGGV